MGEKIGMLTSTYDLILNHLRAGDGFACGGDSVVPDIIKFWTGSNVSHWQTALTRDPVYIKWLVSHGWLTEVKDDLVLIESTTTDKKEGTTEGVQVHYARDRILGPPGQGYPGRVWATFLLDEKRAKLDEKKFLDFAIAHLGQPYARGLIVHLFVDPLCIIPPRERWNEFICSEEGAAQMKTEGFLPANLNTATVTPQKMCQFHLWSDYCQIKGAKQEIKKFSTVEVAA
jgi:hypothetical protein